MSSTDFAELGISAPVLKAVKQLGYEQPSPVQAQSIPILLEGKNLLGTAQTGTGKTAAFALPFLSKLDDKQKSPQILVLTPTRELAIQVAEAFQSYAKFIKGFHVLPIYGGADIGGQLRGLKRGAQVVVGTPGRMLDHLRRRSLDLSQVKGLILDEADEMLDLGFLPDVEKIFTSTPNRQQTMLFSATMPGDIIALARRFMNQPIHIRTQDSEDEGAVVTRIKQHVLRAHALDKIEMLARILQADGRGPTMVFCRTKRTAQKTAEDLMERGFKAAPIHGDLGQSAREKALSDFKAGKSDVLVATDVAARGIDIDGITHVINYQCPEDEKTYVHRIGRTARAGAHGIAVTFVDWDELARWKMINQVLDLGLAEPEETYSSSPHLYEVLDIPAGSTGRITKSKPVIQQKAAPEKRVEKKVESKPKVERTRTRTKKFKES